MYAGIVASMVLAVVALQSVGQGPTALDEISWPWMQEGGGQAGADFAWDNQNVGMFEEGCKAGNQRACDSLAASGEALKILNERCVTPPPPTIFSSSLPPTPNLHNALPSGGSARCRPRAHARTHARTHARSALIVRHTQPCRSRDVGDNMLVAYVPEGEAQQDGGSDLAAGPMGWDENKVPLAYPIDQSDLAGAGDVGNALVPKDDPWAKKKKQAGMYGYPTQLALLQQAAGQGLARKPFYTATDPCRPNGPLCGPTRPAEDHGGDVVLTKVKRLAH